MSRKVNSATTDASRRTPGKTSREAAQHELLENEYRAQIYQILQQMPGLNKNQLARLVGASFTVASFHIRRLVDGGLVVGRPSVQGRDEQLYFITEDQDLWTNERTRILFGRRGARRIAMYVAEHPATTSDEIADEFDLTTDGVRWHLRNLEEHGLVTSGTASGHRVEYFALYDLREWAKRLGDAYDELDV